MKELNTEKKESKTFTVVKVAVLRMSGKGRIENLGTFFNPITENGHFWNIVTALLAVAVTLGWSIKYIYRYPKIKLFSSWC